jgi:hypothetical protein
VLRRAGRSYLIRAVDAEGVGLDVLRLLARRAAELGEVALDVLRLLGVLAVLGHCCSPSKIGGAVWLICPHDGAPDGFLPGVSQVTQHRNALDLPNAP